jgi:hypothetical protein
MTGERIPNGSPEDGAALVLALMILTISMITVGVLIGFVYTGSGATVATRAARAHDYDAASAMAAAIATIRVGTTEGYVGSCLSGGYSPAWTLNDASRPVRVDCFPQSAAALQRRVILSVCPSSIAAPCPDANSLLRADVTFYDDQSFGRAVAVSTWSNQ